MKVVHIVKIMVIVLKMRSSSCFLKDLGEVIDNNHKLDNKTEQCLVRPDKGAGPLQAVPLQGLPAEGLGITGGQKASNLDFPHSVIFINNGGVCAGNILSDKLILTSAHCLDFNKNKNEMSVYAGARFLFDRDADVYKVQDYVIHDSYNKPIRFANDAVLLKVRGKIRFRDIVKPARLVKNLDWKTKGTVVTVAGWGEINPGTSSVSDAMQRVDLKVLSNLECQKSAGTPLSADMFCLWGDGKRGSCLGDSGGGAYWKNRLVGLVSHGGACGQYPGVYTNLVTIKPWIIRASMKLHAKISFSML